MTDAEAELVQKHAPKFCRELAKELRQAFRFGDQDVDAPEGTRWTQASDTLATLTAKRLEQIAEVLER